MYLEFIAFGDVIGALAEIVGLLLVRLREERGVEIAVGVAVAVNRGWHADTDLFLGTAFEIARCTWSPHLEMAYTAGVE